MLGVSTDTVETHERWLSTPNWQGGVSGLRFPLASDVEGTMCRAYGVYVARQNLALRGLFVIDSNGVLQYQVVHNLSVGRSVDEVLRVLEGLQMGGLCPGDRKQGEPTLDLAKEFATGRTIGQYRIEAGLGGGAFGKVYRAHDTVLDRTVALKVLDPASSVPWQALLSEGRAAAALNHPNVCAIHAIELTLGPPMIVMEYVDGRALSALLDGPRFTLHRTAALGRQVALGMAAAHGQGVVHGDLKPANIMVTVDDTAKVMDFGMARRTQKRGTGDTAIWNPTEQGGISGTPAYMAPEQARGEPATVASDVFALGLILYEMATGRLARPQTDLLQLLRGIEQESFANDLIDVPDSIRGLLQRALVADPIARQLSMLEIAEHLAGV